MKHHCIGVYSFLYSCDHILLDMPTASLKRSYEDLYTVRACRNCKKKKRKKKRKKKKEEKKIQILKFITEFKTILEVLYWWCFNILQKMKYVHID